MKRILIVDDSATQRVILKAITNHILSEASLEFEITECADGVQALNCLKEKEYFCVFTDINMEPVNGLELLEKAKEIYPDSRFVFISSHLTDSMHEKAKEAGGEHYITKPLLEEKVKPVLKELFSL